MKLEFSRHIKSHQNPYSGSRVVGGGWTDRQMDGLDEANAQNS